MDGRTDGHRQAEGRTDIDTGFIRLNKRSQRSQPKNEI